VGVIDRTDDGGLSSRLRPRYPPRVLISSGSLDWLLKWTTYDAVTLGVKGDAWRNEAQYDEYSSMVGGYEGTRRKRK
jgi:hypothetical protein